MTQTVIVAVVVLVAALYMGRRAWTTLRPTSTAGCGDGCGCGTDAGSPGGTQDWAKS